MQTADLTERFTIEVDDVPDFVQIAPQLSWPRSGSWLAGLLTSSLDAVIVIDRSRRILLVNREAERMFGIDGAQLLEQSFDMLLPARARVDGAAQLDRLAGRRVRGRRARLRLDMTGLRESGEEFRMEATITRSRTRGELLLVMVLREAAPRADGALPALADGGMRRLAMRSQQKSELEKKRFSRELYDDLGQRLSVLKLDLDWLQANLDAGDPAVADRIVQMQHLLGSAIARTKNIASTLRPPVLDDFGLVPAIEWMIEEFRKQTAIACRLEQRGFALRPGDPAETAVFRLIQEALLNIELHSRATAASIVLVRNGPQLDIFIEDNGIGMPPEGVDRPGCYGLLSMQERVMILGGTISLGNAVPTGFAIHATIPLDHSPNVLVSI